MASCGTQGQVQESPSPPAPSPSPTQSIANAKWEGKWLFDYSLVRLDGVAENETAFTLGSRIKRVWEVTPGCENGPCNSVIVATDPEEPDAPPSKSVVVYDHNTGIYRITQTFPPDPSQSCKGANGLAISGAFEATNVVEVKPTKFDSTSGEPLVTELTSTKTTTFKPAGAAASAGGSCTVKTAVWEGPVTKVLS